MVRENVDRARPRKVSTSSIIWSASNNGPTGIACKNYAVHFESMGSISSIPYSGTWIDERISKHAVTKNGTTPHHVEHRSVQRNAGLRQSCVVSHCPSKEFCRVFGLVSMLRHSFEYSSAAGISTHIDRSEETRSIRIGSLSMDRRSSDYASADGMSTHDLSRRYCNSESSLSMA
jgi:hypothetical protein